MDPDSPYARPVKRTNAFPMGSGVGEVAKGQQLTRELKAAVQAAKETSSLPNNRIEDQNLSEEQMASRYSGEI